MSRRSAFWLAAAVGVGAVLAYLLAARRAAPAAAPAGALWAPDPGPVAAPAVPAPALTVAVAVAVAEPTPAPVAVPAARLSTDDEQPLPTWVRVAIIGGALLAFLAVSLIATRNV